MNQNSKLIYISQGNIPCKWTHSIQIMKMAEGFSQRTNNFVLLTRGPIHSLWESNQRIFDYYGITHSFPLIKVPSVFKWNDEDDMTKSYRFFNMLSLRYAKCFAKPIVYTRHSAVAYQACQLGLPTIFESHSGTDTAGFSYQKLIKDHPKLLGVVLTSHQLEEAYLQEGFPAKSLLVQPNAVNLDLFQITADQKSLREKLQLPLEKPVALYSGHLFPFKGIDLVIACAEQMPQVTFVIVGGSAPDVQRYSEATAHIKNIKFTGFVANTLISHFLCAADILLLPNLSSTPLSNLTPIKLFEYCAAQRPIVASDLKPFRDFLVHGKNALLFQADEVSSLKSMIERLIADPNLRSELSRQAYEIAQQNTWIKRADAILSRFAPELLIDQKGTHP